MKKLLFWLFVEKLMCGRTSPLAGPRRATFAGTRGNQSPFADEAYSPSRLGDGGASFTQGQCVNERFQICRQKVRALWLPISGARSALGFPVRGRGIPLLQQRLPLVSYLQSTGASFFWFIFMASTCRRNPLLGCLASKKLSLFTALPCCDICPINVLPRFAILMGAINFPTARNGYTDGESHAA